MSKKKENIALQRQQAEAKKQAILSNNAALQTKLQNIQRQIRLNDEKLQKIDFFLGSLSDTKSDNPE